MTVERLSKSRRTLPPPLLIGHDNLHAVFTSPAFIIPLFKEKGYSSGFFVNQVRKRLSHARKNRKFKVGHAGTLDPFAEGVLILLCGKATRFQDEWMRKIKTYEGKIRLGETTPSLDPDTEISERDEGFALNKEDLPKVLKDFDGDIEQVPPNYSAKHIDGERAYKLAREGKEIKLEPRNVHVESIELMNVEDNDFSVRVVSGSGFYVRALARDIAAKLGTLGYLSELTRTEAGGLKIEQCLRLREVLDAQMQ